MEVEVISRKDNELLQRIELEFKVTHPNEGSPRREAIRDAIAKSENANKELVIIDHMRHEYGLASTKGFAKIYRDKEFALSLERKHILVRNGLIAEEKKEVKEKKKKPEAKPKEEKPEKPEEKEEKKTKEKGEKREKEEKPKEVPEKKEKPKEAPEKPKKGEVQKEKPSEKTKK